MGRLTKEEEKRRKKNQWSIESHKKTTKMIGVRFHLVKESELLNQLSKQENPSAYIKNLIREDMKKNQKGEN